MTWNKNTLGQNSISCWKAGNKEVYVKKSNKEWFISVLENDKLCSPSKFDFETNTEKELTDWTTFIGDKSNTLIVSPAFPDRPVVIKPTAPVKVIQGKSVQFFVQIPVWLQFYFGSRKPENLLMECASQELPSTWFGEPDNGTLAYSKSIDPGDSLQMPRSAKHYIYCPLKLINDSNTILDVQRALLHCEHLSIYSVGDKLLANETRIKFKGEKEISDVHYASTPPFIEQKPVQLAPARLSRSFWVISKSFDFFKSLSNY